MTRCFALRTRIQMLLVMAVLAAAVPAQEVEAGGGQITPANLDFIQSLSQWYFFYSSSNPAANTTISFSGSQYEAGGNYKQINLPSTSGYYLISDASDPFGTALAAAELGEFDTHFNISATESATKLFNDTSAFASDAGVSTPALSLVLPTLYIPGENDTRAFRVGLAQAGSNFVFVVPKSSAVGMDGQTYDYQFFLPYSNDSMTFYVFSIVPPAAPSIGPGTVVTPSLDYQWTYDGATLQILTSTGVSINLVDEIGKSYNANSGNFGHASLDVYPGRYILHLYKDGYKDLSDTIYLPGSAHKKETPPPEKKTPDQLDKVTVARSQEGITICVGDACYFQNMTQADSAQMLSDLTCTGSLCELVNITPGTFITKHQMRRIGAGAASGADRPSALNIPGLIDAVGKDLSSRLSGQNAQATPVELAAMVIGLLAMGLAVFWGSKYMAQKRARLRGGYG